MKGVNKQNVTAILIAGFVGWLLISVTFGRRLKALLKKVPILNMVFPKAKRTPRTRRAPARRRMRK